MNNLRLKIFLCCICLSVSVLAFADGGFWLPTQIQGKIHRMMKKEGLRLSEKDIYDINQACLSDAILSLSYEDGTFTPFASASFISGEGLVLTNFHCVMRYLEHISDAEHDYVKYGCWATKREEETPLFNLQVNQLVSIQDVTADMIGQTEGLSGAALNKQINQNGTQVMKTVKKSRGIQGKVYSLFGGQQYVLAVYRSFKDVRIVAAPPISMGKFGGDTDNWQWPRYSADFAVLRVYANDKNQPASYNKNNRPYQPESYLTISGKGVRENDFVMIAGYPAQTRRYIPSFSLDKIIFQDTQAEADIAKIKLGFYTERKENTDSLYSYYNVMAGGAANIYLRASGEINGVREADLISEKEKEEQLLMKWIQADDDRKKRYGEHLLADMKDNYLRLTKLNFTEQMFQQVALNGATVIPFAGKFEKLIGIARQNRKNMQAAMKGEVRKLKALTESFYRDFKLEDDKEIMKKLLAVYLERVDTVYYSSALKKLAAHYPETLSCYVDSLYQHSLLHDRQKMLAFLDSVPQVGVDALRDDPLYQLALGFYFMHVDKVVRQKQNYQGKNMELYSDYLQAYAEMHKGELLPFDANRTLRYSTGKVKSAIPGEGIKYMPFTTVDGLMARKRMFTGDSDFSLPVRFAGLIEQKDFGTYWKKNETPVCCFLTDAHTTSGSSGSPVLNGRGELVGINFDRIWQGLASDYKLDANKSRNIVVDIRYILWVIEKYSASAYLLNELKIQH